MVQTTNQPKGTLPKFSSPDTVGSPYFSSVTGPTTNPVDKLYIILEKLRKVLEEIKENKNKNIV